MKKIPWSQEFVDELNKHQDNLYVHPYTCGNRNTHDHQEYFVSNNKRDVGVLIATVNGWVCPVCGYTQDWAHDHG